MPTAICYVMQRYVPLTCLNETPPLKAINCIWPLLSGGSVACAADSLRRIHLKKVNRQLVRFKSKEHLQKSGRVPERQAEQILRLGM
jgi:hypothetical protein